MLLQQLQKAIGSAYNYCLITVLLDSTVRFSNTHVKVRLFYSVKRVPNQQLALNKLPTELRCRNFV